MERFKLGSQEVDLPDGTNEILLAVSGNQPPYILMKGVGSQIFWTYKTGTSLTPQAASAVLTLIRWEILEPVNPVLEIRKPEQYRFPDNAYRLTEKGKRLTFLGRR